MKRFAKLLIPFVVFGLVMGILSIGPASAEYPRR